MTWNPSGSSQALGLEWPVTRQGGVRLSAPGDSAAAKFTSSGAQTVTGVQVYLSRVLGSPRIKVRAIPTSSIPETVTTNTYRPNEDVSLTAASGWTGVPTDTAGSLYTNIDEATLDTADYVTTSASGPAYVRVNSGAATLSNITAVRVKAVVGSSNGTSNWIPYVSIGGVDYAGAKTFVSASDGPTTVVHEWLTNPATGAAWTQADVRAFDTTDEIQVRTDPATIDGIQFIYQKWIEVDTATSAPVFGLVSPTAAGWATVTFGSSWSKANATEYLLVMSKENADGEAIWSALDSGDACPHVSWASTRPTLTDAGLVSAVGSAATQSHPIILTVAGAAAADSQPYATLAREGVYSGRTVEQEFTPSSARTYGNLAVVVARQGATVGADLLLKLKRRSDDMQMGGTVTLTEDDVDTTVRSLREVFGAMASTAALSSGVQYYVEASSTAPDGSGWEVAVLDTEGQGASAGMGGTTDAATVAGTQDTDRDAPLPVHAAPATITGVTATETGTGANLHALVEWTTSAETNFEAYLIYRGGELIATETTKATVSFPDYEARAGVEESYTVVQRTTYGTMSLASTAALVTLTAPALSRFTSNQDPSLNVELLLLPPLSRSRFQDRNEYEPLGADHVKVHRGSQARGYAFDLKLEVEGAELDGDALFTDLLNAAQADVSHVALITAWGDRHFVTLEYGSDELALLLNIGQASVRARTVTPTPVEG